jgi:hypothetical protein
MKLRILCQILVLFLLTGLAGCGGGSDGGGVTTTAPTWQLQNSGVPSDNYTSGVWNGFKYVLFGTSSNNVISSTDGKNWISVNPGYLIRDSVWNGNIFVAVGELNSGILTGLQNSVMTSRDGIIWAPKIIGGSNSYLTVVWNGNLFIAVRDSLGGYGSNLAIDQSLDGVTWSNISIIPAALGIGNALRDMAWTGTMYVAVGYDPVSNLGLSMTSADGISWTRQPLVETAQLSSVAWNGTILVAAGTDRANAITRGVIYTSTDGATWTKRYDSVNGGVESVVWTGAQFSAIDWRMDKYLTSLDGVIWTSEASPSTNVYALTAGGGKIIAHGNLGTIYIR